MNRILLAIAVSCTAHVVFAQTQLPNVGFENWTNVGNNTEEPTDYNSNKTGGGLANLSPQTCFRNSSPHAGSYCVELRTQSTFGTPVNGTATTGKLQAPSTQPEDGYIETQRSSAGFHWAFTGQPDSLVGYYKYQVAGSDQGKVQVYLHGDYDVRNPLDANSQPYVYAIARFLTPQADVSTWTRFSVPFVYSSNTVPSYALVVCTSSSEAATAVSGSKMWLDDIQVVYAPTVGTDELDADAQKIQAYWQDDALVLDMRHAGTQQGKLLQVFDLQGKLALESDLTAEAIQRFQTTLPEGVYVVRVLGGRLPFSVKTAKVN